MLLIESSHLRNSFALTTNDLKPLQIAVAPGVVLGKEVGVRHTGVKVTRQCLKKRGLVVGKCG